MANANVTLSWGPWPEGYPALGGFIVFEVIIVGGEATYNEVARTSYLLSSVDLLVSVGEHTYRVVASDGMSGIAEIELIQITVVETDPVYQGGSGIGWDPGMFTSPRPARVPITPPTPTIVIPHERWGVGKGPWRIVRKVFSSIHWNSDI
jgi:hypothetical protein